MHDEVAISTKLRNLDGSLIKTQRKFEIKGLIRSGMLESEWAEERYEGPNE